MEERFSLKKMFRQNSEAIRIDGEFALPPPGFSTGGDDPEELLRYKEQYEGSRPVVAYIVFDNREELSLLNKDNETVEISSAVDKQLEDWANEVCGVLRRLRSGRYLLITEERHFVPVLEKRFPIIDRIHRIMVDDRIHATISIGVGRGGVDFTQNDFYANEALDLALARGGDQAAVKCGQVYSFFGGSSKGIERRTKIRTRTTANEVSDHILKSDTVFIMGHRFSDMDSIGSAIGMCSAARKGQNIRAYVVTDQRTTLSKPLIDAFIRQGFSDYFISPSEALQIITKKSLLIIVDTNLAYQLESTPVFDKCARRIVIDHHRKKVESIEGATIFYHEPTASSTAEMVTELVQYLGDRTLTRLEANSLLAGIVLDTKSFVIKTGVRTFEAAAYLRRKGADTVEVKELFSISADDFRNKSKLVQDAEYYRNCAVTVAEQNLPAIRILSAQAADELLSVSGADASFVIYRDDNGISISARSYGKVNVQLVMEEIGGGGHLTMAGAQLRGHTIAEARDCLLRAIDKQLGNRTVQIEG